MQSYLENHPPTIPKIIKMQDPNRKKYMIEIYSVFRKTLFAKKSRPDYLNWQLLESDDPTEEVPFNLEEAAQWIAGASGRSLHNRGHPTERPPCIPLATANPS